jgi:hypothetical protein
MKMMLGIAAVATVAAAVAALGVSPRAAHAQTTVYDCGGNVYSEKPCAGRVVRTDEAPVDLPPKSKKGEAIAHRLPGETDDALALRQRRLHMTESDRDECARLDKKIPFEQQRLKSSVREDETESAKETLAIAKKRFAKLNC